VVPDMYIILFTVAVDIVANPRCGNISQYKRLTEKKIQEPYNILKRFEMRAIY